MCDRAAVIKEGKIIAVEHIQDLLKKQMKKVTLVFKESKEGIGLPKGAKNEKWHNTKVTFEYVGI